MGTRGIWHLLHRISRALESNYYLKLHGYTFVCICILCDTFDKYMYMYVSFHSHEIRDHTLARIYQSHSFRGKNKAYVHQNCIVRIVCVWSFSIYHNNFQCQLAQENFALSFLQYNFYYSIAPCNVFFFPCITGVLLHSTGFCTRQ